MSVAWVSEKDYQEHFDTRARWSRRMQFCAGPEQHTFYACHNSECRTALLRGDVGSSCFFVIVGEPMMPVDPEDDIRCDVCREG